MVGDVVILHGNGWSCTNQGKLEVTNVPLFDAKGEIIAVKKQNVLWAQECFHVVGNIGKNDNVECLIEITEGQKVLFTAIVDGVAKSGTVQATMIGDSAHDNKLITKFIERVRKWQEE